MPILTGEDIYLKEAFIKLIDMGAVDMIHPDLASSGGLIETKKIGDYAMEHGVAMAMHFAGTPISLHGQRPLRRGDRELHRARAPLARRAVVGEPGHDDRRQAARRKGFAVVPDSPGLGVELNEEVVKQHLRPKSGYFDPDAGVGQRSAATIGPGADGRARLLRVLLANLVEPLLEVLLVSFFSAGSFGVP